MDLIPLSNKIIVKEIETKGEQQTKSGFYIPEADKNTNITSGEVISVGPGMIEDGKLMEEIIVKKGDVVYFHKGIKNDITIAGEKYTVITNSGILCYKKN